jgi:hypothetical protein
MVKQRRNRKTKSVDLCNQWDLIVGIRSFFPEAVCADLIEGGYNLWVELLVQLLIGGAVEVLRSRIIAAKQNVGSVR